MALLFKSQPDLRIRVQKSVRVRHGTASISQPDQSRNWIFFGGNQVPTNFSSGEKWQNQLELAAFAKENITFDTPHDHEREQIWLPHDRIYALSQEPLLNLKASYMPEKPNWNWMERIDAKEKLRLSSFVLTNTGIKLIKKLS